MTAVNDAAGFRRALGLAVLRAKGRSHRFQQALLLEGLRRLVLRTPVDTGRARGAWEATADTPATSSPVGAQDKNGSGTIAKGAGIISGILPGQVGYVVNNVAYIDELEKGHSQQAPNGMVTVTLEELKLVSDRLVAQVVEADGG